MSEIEEFGQLLERVRSGDQDAAEQLVRDYEGLIRREVRLRIEDSRLRRTLDSMDFVQSVMASFFVRNALGDYEFNEPRDLVRLLMTMTRNKVASAARHANADKRDQRLNQYDTEALHGIPDGDETPSRLMSLRELYEQARSCFTEEELQLAQMRIDGLSWEEIAALLGGTAQARRTQHSRTLSRICRQLGLND